jgi:hypothetical protein
MCRWEQPGLAAIPILSSIEAKPGRNAPKEDKAMNAARNIFSIATVAAVAAAVFAASPAEAGRGKEVFIQDYQFSKPMHGYSGHSGNYYCDYQRLPQRKCVVLGGHEVCKIVGWTLREMCQ